MASYSHKPQWDLRTKSAGVLEYTEDKYFETKKVNFQGHLIEVSIPKGSLADYMFERGKPSHA